MNCESLREFKCNTPFPFAENSKMNVDLLRIVAIVCMTLDHLCKVLLPGNEWMNYLGRIAFPIFAFQIAEGFIHTSNLKQYFLRIVTFAFLSEIPFDLVFCGEFFYFDYQNVLFTFALSILALAVLEKIKKSPTPKTILVSGILFIAVLVVAHFFEVDYGVAGVLTVVAFYIFRTFPLAWFFQLISLIFINVFLFPGRSVLTRIFGEIISFPVQIFALFSLVPIWLYNGKKGNHGKAFQYGFYLFYPLHLLILYVVSFSLN